MQVTLAVALICPTHFSRGPCEVKGVGVCSSAWSPVLGQQVSHVRVIALQSPPSSKVRRLDPLRFDIVSVPPRTAA